MITIRTQAASWPRESEARRRTMSTIATIQAMVATIPRSQSQSTLQPYGFGEGRERLPFGKQEKAPGSGAFLDGRYWARTSDPQLVELVLSQLS